MENEDPNRINPNAANFDIGMIKNEKLNDPIKYKILPHKWSFDKDYIFPKDKNAQQSVQTFLANFVFMAQIFY